jgi:hypothetical protein
MLYGLGSGVTVLNASTPLARPQNLGVAEKLPAADSGPPGATREEALDAHDGGMCCCATCVAAPSAGRCGTRDVDDATSSPIKMSSLEESRCTTIRTIMSSKKSGKNLSQSPYLACQMSDVNSSRVVESTRLILRTRGQPRVSLWRCKNIRTHKGLEWFGPPEHNTLRPL